MRTRGDGIQHGECYKTENHEAEQLEVMRAEKGQSAYGGAIGLLVFEHESQSTEEQEHGYAVMTEVREKLHESEMTWEVQLIDQSDITAVLPLVFVFLDGETQPVAIVVKDDA